MSLLRYWVWLATLPGVSLRTQIRLLGHYEDPEEIFRADRKDLERTGILSRKELDSLDSRDLKPADQVLEDCRRHGYGILTIQDAAYPARLRTIDMPPLVLYYQGTLLSFDLLPVIAVVGSRSASPYGLTMAKRLGYQLAREGGVVVSGAARGVDALALEGALSADAPVAAVLGNGLDVVYPREARRLYQDIAKRGCLLSEYVPGTAPLAQNFPRRNRIMSGLSMGVLVVEAPKSSVSLITAEFALEQGRDVFAVPGNVGQVTSEGGNRLIQEGAQLVTCGWDILEGYQAMYGDRLQFRKGGEDITLSPGDEALGSQPEKNRRSPAKKPAPQDQTEPEKRIDNAGKRNYIDLEQIQGNLTPEERKILQLLQQQGERQVDEIIVGTELSAAQVLSSMTMLEIKGYVIQLPGKRFTLRQS